MNFRTCSAAFSVTVIGASTGVLGVPGAGAVVTEDSGVVTVDMVSFLS